MANSNNNNQLFTSDSPDSGIELETLSQYKHIQHNNIITEGEDNRFYSYGNAKFLQNNYSSVNLKQQQLQHQHQQQQQQHRNLSIADEFNQYNQTHMNDNETDNDNDYDNDNDNDGDDDDDDDNNSDQQLGCCKFENPLSEPIVRISLQKVKITGPQLVNMSVKELNKRLAHCPAFVIAKLKKCRRTLKNRGYAKNCRIKRIAMKNRLEEINKNLILENRELRQNNKSLLDQLNQLLTNCNSNQIKNNQNNNSTNQNEINLINKQNLIVEQTISNNLILNQHHHNHRQGESTNVIISNNNSNNVEQQNDSYGLTSILSDYNPTYSNNDNNNNNNNNVSVISTACQQQEGGTLNLNETYYPIESELDYLADQLALDQ